MTSVLLSKLAVSVSTAKVLLTISESRVFVTQKLGSLQPV